MNIPTGDDRAGTHPFDSAARALHVRAVERVPARTLRQLRAGRKAAVEPARTRAVRTFGWAAAAACAAVFAIAIGLRPDQAAMDASEPPKMAAVDVPGNDADADADVLAPLDEDPGLYLWLASSDAQPLAME